MSELTKQHVNELNSFAQKKGILKFLNTHFSSNNLAHYEVESIKLKLKDGKVETDAQDCADGYELREICTISGKCFYKCVPKLPANN